MTNQVQDLTQDDEIRAQELSTEQLKTALGGAGAGKVSMQDFHFSMLLPAV